MHLIAEMHVGQLCSTGSVKAANNGNDHKLTHARRAFHTETPGQVRHGVVELYSAKCFSTRTGFQNQVLQQMKRAICKKDGQALKVKASKLHKPSASQLALALHVAIVGLAVEGFGD